jgi:hypothetical protein
MTKDSELSYHHRRGSPIAEIVVVNHNSSAAPWVDMQAGSNASVRVSYAAPNVTAVSVVASASLAALLLGASGAASGAAAGAGTAVVACALCQCVIPHQTPQQLDTALAPRLPPSMSASRHAKCNRLAARRRRCSRTAQLTDRLFVYVRALYSTTVTECCRACDHGE